MPADKSVVWHPPTTVRPSELHAPLPPEYARPDLIPPPTTHAPGELLDKFYSDTRRLPEWMDPNALLKIQSSLVGSNCRCPNDRAAQRVPVSGVALDGPQVKVDFRNLDHKCSSSGMPLRDLYTNDATMLEGAGDIFPNGFGTGDLNFIIAWPGYKSERFPIRTVHRNGEPLTRFDLGRIIAMAYARVFMTVEEGKVLPSDVGCYNIALHQGQRAKPDSLGVQLMQLHLVRLRGRVGGNWVADVDIA